jgi:uncharacterized membrane protein YphA (DoxX/SURF4 family)
MLVLSLPFLASAHEVYVLGRSVIEHDTTSASPNPFLAAQAEPAKFALWGFIFLVQFIVVVLIARWPWLQVRLNPLLDRLKPYAPLVGRLTLGGSLLASAYYGALFGPELPLVDFAGPYAGWVQILLYILSGLILLGLLTPVAGIIAAGLYMWVFVHFGTYLLTYFNYFGEMLLVIILGGHVLAIDTLVRGRAKTMMPWLEKYAFLILRICFGVAVIFASFYAKYLHSDLALDTVNDFHLTQFFPFAPLFLVLGAFLTETLMGLCFLFGFAIRFTALAFIGFLVLSILYFGEAVWPHLILFGVNVALFMHGYDD